MTTVSLFARRAMWILWPAFLAAAVGEFVFFSVFDPLELHIAGAPLELTRQAIYTMGFFAFWGLCIASSALTMLLETSTRDEDGRAGGYFAGEPEAGPDTRSNYGDKGAE